MKELSWEGGGGLAGPMPHGREVADCPGLRVNLQSRTQLGPANWVSCSFAFSYHLWACSLWAVLGGPRKEGRQAGQGAEEHGRKVPPEGGLCTDGPLSRASHMSDVVALLIVHRFQAHVFKRSHL